MTEQWDDSPDNEGVTPGPEEALHREIQKSKALKVERLQLRNEIERLLEENKALKLRVADLESQSIDHTHASRPVPHSSFIPLPVAILIITVLGLLAYLLEKN